MKATGVPMSRVADVPISSGEHRVRRGAAIATFAERVRGRRLELGLTRTRLAHAAGIIAETVANIEEGRHEPRAYTFAAIAAALETTMDALWYGDTDRSAQNDQNG